MSVHATPGSSSAPSGWRRSQAASRLARPTSAAAWEGRRAASSAILATACLVLAAWAAGCDRPEPPAPSVPRDPMPPDWPMFRGAPDMRSVARGSLPDALALVWTFKTEDAVRSSAAIAGGRVFVGSDDGHLYAIDLASGKRVWAFKTGDTVEASPLVLGGIVYVGSSDGFLYAVDAAAGTLKWKYETGDKILGAANWVASPDGASTWILVGSYDARLHCVEADTGKAVWTLETDNFINGAAAVSAGKTVFGSCDALIHVVGVADGKETASIEAGAYIAGSAAMVDGRVYVGHYEGELLCADLATSQVVWRYGDGETSFYSSPAVGERTVVIGARDKRLHAVDRATGKRLWTFATRGDVDSSPVICGDKVVVGSGDGRLYMVRLVDGRQVWSFETGKAVSASPAVAADRVVVGAEDGVVYCFGPKP